MKKNPQSISQSSPLAALIQSLGAIPPAILAAWQASDQGSHEQFVANLDPARQAAEVFDAARIFGFGDLDFQIEVICRDPEWKNESVWSVCRGNTSWSKADHCFVFEPMPSNRTEAYLRDTRFTFQEAVRLAKLIAGAARNEWESIR